MILLVVIAFYKPESQFFVFIFQLIPLSSVKYVIHAKIIHICSLDLLGNQDVTMHCMWRRNTFQFQ
jgi:hypothetical protein